MHIYFWSRKGEPFWTYRNAPRLTRHYLPRCSKWVVHFQRPLKTFVARVPPKKSHKCQGERIWRGGRPSRFCTTPRRFFQPKPRGPTQLGCPSFKMKLWPPRKKWCRQESSVFFSHQAFQKLACYPLEFRLFSSNIKWWKNPIASCPTPHNQPLFWFGSVVRCVATSRSLGRLGQALHTTGRINLMGRIPLVTNRLKVTEIICWNEITNNFVGWVPRKTSQSEPLQKTSYFDLYVLGKHQGHVMPSSPVVSVPSGGFARWSHIRPWSREPRHDPMSSFDHPSFSSLNSLF